MALGATIALWLAMVGACGGICACGSHNRFVLFAYVSLPLGFHILLAEPAGQRNIDRIFLIVSVSALHDFLWTFMDFDTLTTFYINCILQRRLF